MYRIDNILYRKLIANNIAMNHFSGRNRVHRDIKKKKMVKPHCE